MIKKIVIYGIKATAGLKEVFTLPLHALRHGLHSSRRHPRLPFKRIVSVPHEGAFNGREEAEHTLDVIVDLLKDAGIDYFIVPGKDDRNSVAVMVDYRRTSLDLVSKSKKLTGYYCLVHKEKRNLWLPRLLAHGLSRRNEKNTLAVTLYRNIGGKGQRIVYGKPYAVTLEFWLDPKTASPYMKEKAMSDAGIIDESMLEGAVIAPIPNGVTSVVKAGDKKKVDMVIAGKVHPTLKVFTNKLLGKVSYPIDLVYTWVDDSDPNWLQRYEAARQELDINFKNNTSARYANYDELKYSLRSVEMFAPWANNIYIVTDGQIPSWLNTKHDGRVKIIDHKDIFTDTDALPVFNSHAIESQLHHITGLSEHFLYINDDVFFANPTSPETFFHPNGIAKVQPSRAIIGTGEPTIYESAPSSAGKNARKIIKNTFGVYITNKFRHTALPQIKSYSRQVENDNKRLIDKTMRSKFRHPNDVPFASILMQSFLLASGQGVADTYQSKTISDLYKTEVIKEMTQMMYSQDLVTFCINEVSRDGKGEQVAIKRMSNFLDAYYPYPASWEK